MREETNKEERKQGALILFNKKVSSGFSKRKVSFSIHELVYEYTIAHHKLGATLQLKMKEIPS